MVYDRLAADKPLMITRPVDPAAAIDMHGYLSACEWLDAASAPSIVAETRARARRRDRGRAARAVGQALLRRHDARCGDGAVPRCDRTPHGRVGHLVRARRVDGRRTRTRRRTRPSSTTRTADPVRGSADARGSLARDARSRAAGSTPTSGGSGTRRSPRRPPCRARARRGAVGGRRDPRRSAARSRR